MASFQRSWSQTKQPQRDPYNLETIKFFKHAYLYLEEKGDESSYLFENIYEHIKDGHGKLTGSNYKQVLGL